MHGIIRVRNLHSSDINSTEEHNKRQYEKGDFPSNINQDRIFESYNRNSQGYEGQEWEYGKHTMKDCLESRLKELEIKPRKNSVVALEYVLAISPEAMKKIQSNPTSYSSEYILRDLVDFVKDKHKPENVINISLHFDESNPHAHVVVVPNTKKNVKWKNKNGSGEREKNVLSAREHTGNKFLLRKLQDDYHNYVSSRKWSVGVEFTRGLSSKEQKKKYEKKTNHVLGKIRAELSDLKQLYSERKISDAQMIKKARELDKKTKEVKKEMQQQSESNQKKIFKNGKKSFDETTKEIMPQKREVKSNLKTPSKNNNKSQGYER